MLRKNNWRIGGADYMTTHFSTGVTNVRGKSGGTSLFSGIKLFSGKRVGKMSFAQDGFSISIQYSSGEIEFDKAITRYLIDQKLPEYIAKSQSVSSSFPIGYQDYKNWLAE